MYWICNDCGEAFEMPFYRKNRSGIKIPLCPACGGYDIEEQEEEDYDYDDFVEYEEMEDDN